jgi:hypothetical protein
MALLQAKNVTNMGENRHPYRILVRKQFERLRRGY